MGHEIAGVGRTVIRLLVSRENIFHGNGYRRRFSCRISEQGSCGGGDNSSAIRLGYQRQTRHTHDQRSRRTAPNRHADSGGPAPQGRAAVPGNLPWPVPIHRRSLLRRQSKKRLAHSPKGASRSVRLTAGADRPGDFSVTHGSRSGGGREDVGMAKSQARSSLGQRHADPVCPPTHRRTATCLATTAVEICGGGRRPIKAAGYLGGPGPQRRSRCSLDAWGHRGG